jgi:hypothetical protein
MRRSTGHAMTRISGGHRSRQPGTVHAVTRQVYEEPRVSRSTYLSVSEPRLRWFLESTRREAVEGRRIINDMYSRFPDDDGRLFAELHARDDKRLLSALDELLVHDFLVRRYCVAYEEGHGTRPDFRLYDRTGGYVGAVEVMTLFLREDWAAEQRRHAVLSDQLNQRMALTTHSVDFEIARWDRTPSVRHIVGWLQRTIDDLRDDRAALPLDEGGTPEKVYRSQNAEIVFRFVALPSTYVVEDGDKVVVTGAALGGCVDSALRLRERLDEKRSSTTSAASRSPSWRASATSCATSVRSMGR